VSNALGTVNPVKRLIEMANYARGIPVRVDGAQAVPHLPWTVQDLGCEFYVLRPQALPPPTGVGTLYGKTGLLGAHCRRIRAAVT